MYSSRSRKKKVMHINIFNFKLLILMIVLCQEGLLQMSCHCQQSLQGHARTMTEI